jgi:phosphomannomutase
MALILHLLAETGETITELINSLPRFAMIKEKMACPSDKVLAILRLLRQEFTAYPMDLRDGVKVTLPNGWLLVRGSNTEPIIRVIAEAKREADARAIIDRVYSRVRECAG